MSTRTRTILTAVVAALWVANFVATGVVEDYNPSDSVNAIFASVIGGLFATREGGDDGTD